MAIKIFKSDLYGVNFEVFIEESMENIKKHFKKRAIQVDGESLKGWLKSLGCTVNLEQNGTGAKKILIFINKLQPSTVAHECFHATESIFDHVGILHSESSSEAWAYCLGWVVQNVCKSLELKC